MSNDHYLIVSYFAGLALSLALAALTYRLFREPFGRIVEAALKDSKSIFLKRALPVALTVGAGVSFLGVSYTYDACRTYKYEQIVRERSYLHKKNREQLVRTSITMAQVIVMFSVAAAICIVVMKKDRGEP